MSANDYYPEQVAMPNNELFEIHRSKISLHRAQGDYRYPTIRLPYRFSKLAGLRTRIYQTVHAGALAFLIVVSSTSTSPDKRENAHSSAKSSVFTRWRSPVRIWPSPLVFVFVGAEAFV